MSRIRLRVVPALALVFLLGALEGIQAQDQPEEDPLRTLIEGGFTADNGDQAPEKAEPTRDAREAFENDRAGVQAPENAEWPNNEEVLIERIKLKQARVVDALRLLSELSDLNVVATEEAGKKEVTLYLRNLAPNVVLGTLCKVSGLWFRSEEDGGPIRVMTTGEYQRDLVVFREEKTKVFTLLHPNAVAVATGIEDLYGSRVRLSLGLNEDDLFPSSLGGLGGLSGSGGLGGLGGLGGRGIGGFGAERGVFGLRNQFGAGYSGLNARQLGSSRFRNRGLGYGGIGFRPSEGYRGTLPIDPLQNQQLTAQQIEKIEERLKDLQEAVERGQKPPESSDPLAGISRHEAPIYVTVNRQHNLVLVRTQDQAALKDLERLIVSIDRPTPQVLLEMKILEVVLGDDFRSIVDLDITTGPQKSGPETNQPRNPLLPGQTQAPRNVFGLGNFLNEGGTLVYQFMSDQVRARIQLQAQMNRINVLATPLILCANDRTARIFIGEERPLVRNFEVQSTITETIARETLVPVTELVDIGTTLIIRPRINADRTVTLEIQQEVSFLNPAGATLPVAFGGAITQQPVDTVDTSSFFGTVVGKDGLTMAVGGLIRESFAKQEQKVPFLGDIPVLGMLFKRKITNRTRRELILLITPYILLTPAEGLASTQARMKALSIHPFHDYGDAALGTYTKDDLPFGGSWNGQAPKQELKLDRTLDPELRPFLDPIPEPAQ